MKAIITFLILFVITLPSLAQYQPPRREPGTFELGRYHFIVRNKDGQKVHETHSKQLVTHGALPENGDVHIRGYYFTQLKVNEGPEVIVFSPQKNNQIRIPSYPPTVKDAKLFLDGPNTITAQEANIKDLLTYRNLAFNPYDWQDSESSFYPHVTASSECRNELLFAARNCIDGNTNNQGHANWEFRSWGPEKETSPWIEIDFGRQVEIDQVVLHLRADFPHDGYWHSGVLEFDDGSRIDLKLKKTHRAQTFKFDKKKTRQLKLTQLQQKEPLQWCALTEIEAWGRDVTPFVPRDTWEQTLQSLTWQKGMVEDSKYLWLQLEQYFPVETDWLMQDYGMNSLALANEKDKSATWKELAQKVLKDLQSPSDRSRLSQQLDDGHSPLTVYLQACQVRRAEFLSILENTYDSLVFVKRHPIVPSFFAYTEGASDARNEFHFTPGSELCLLTLNNGEIKTTTLLKDAGGVIRDPDVSYDGKRILFAWKKSLYEDDYHLYEMTLADRSIRQITHGERKADFEGKYLPTGDIVFNSTRCEQAVDCWLVEVSNLYLVREDGSFLRRIGFDQVQTPYPTVTEAGKIIYTRWDYNDRGQTFPQPLFIMNPDGTGQTELYGNNSWYPTTMVHARQIPGTQKIMATLCGHHTAQRGQLAIIDPSKGRQENEGVQLIAPEREEEPVRIDAYGQNGPQFQFPYPLSEDHFLVTYEPYHTGNRQYISAYNLYFMDRHGRRELLAADDILDAKQVVPLAPRTIQRTRPSLVDYQQKKGVYYVQNVYHGEGAEGIEPGSIEKIRVVALDFRAAPVGRNHGSANECNVNTANIASTPIALGQGAWDVKIVLGEVPVEKDGSALFEVPARTPVYFQLIDKKGYVAQTMRSWSTLQPGETFSCIGCHENKNQSVPMTNRSMAMTKGVQPLQHFHGEPRGFSFRQEIQPILNKHCIECHSDRSVKRLNQGQTSVADLADTPAQFAHYKGKAFSLLDVPVSESVAKRDWNDAYLNLLQPTKNNQWEGFKAQFKHELINWPGMQSVPTLLPPYYRGAATSELMKMLEKQHGGVQLSREELEKIACWIDLQVPYCGDYKEANDWSKEDMQFYDYYLGKRKTNAQEEQESIKAYIKQLNGE
jgi:hypothetical protein